MAHRQPRRTLDNAYDLKAADRQRLVQGVAHLHRLGERPTAEFMIEAAKAKDGTEQLLDRLDRWRGLDPDKLKRAGGDKWTRPLQVVRGRP